MTGYRAEVGELSILAGPENDNAARPLTDDSVRGSPKVGKAHVMLGSVAIDQGYLHHVIGLYSQCRVHLAVNVPANADKGQQPLGNLRSQSESYHGSIGDWPSVASLLRCCRS
jgi:hypothetical protein